MGKNAFKCEICRKKTLYGVDNICFHCDDEINAIEAKQKAATEGWKAHHKCQKCNTGLPMHKYYKCDKCDVAVKNKTEHSDILDIDFDTKFYMPTAAVHR